MCGILGAWSPSSAQGQSALAGLALSRKLAQVSMMGTTEMGARAIARWVWPEGAACWSEVTDTLGVSLSNALRALNHRGPDGAGFYLSPCRQVWLAHTRLAVRGARGTQPLGFNPTQGTWSVHATSPRQSHVDDVGPSHHNPAGHTLVLDRSETVVWATVNGELYDTPASARSPNQRCITPPSPYSDSLHLIRHYHQYGILEARPEVGEAHRGLRGEYAFALWDERRARLWLGRDPFGVKPLVYAWRSGRLYFASEVKALLALGLCDLTPQWDIASLERSLLYQYTPPSRTYFSGVSTLPSGSSLIVSERGQRLISAPLDQIHDTTGISAKTESHSEHHTAEETPLRDALLAATALRLDADVPLCFQLSGGLDSSAIVGAARALGVSRPVTFSLVFDDAAYNEADQAQEVARALKAEWRPVHATRARLLDALSDSVFYAEGICINGQMPAKRLLCSAMRDQGMKVCLSGEGADEALLGYPHLMRDAYPESYETLVHYQPQTASVMLCHDPHTIPALDRRWGYTPHFLSAKFNLLAPLRSLFDVDAFGGEHSLSERSPAWTSLSTELLLRGQNISSLNPLQRARHSMWTWTRLCLTGYILRGIGDGMEMAASIEGRPVYLDPRLFNLATRMATLTLGESKASLRAATQGLIPDQARLAPKRSLLAPPLSVPSPQSDDDLVQRLLSVSAASWSCIPGLSPRRTQMWLECMASATPTQRAAVDVPLTMLMSFYELHQRLHLTLPSSSLSPSFP